ncbi:hypothetical protein CR513_23305, partial [Mucuna pruriens]
MINHGICVLVGLLLVAVFLDESLQEGIGFATDIGEPLLQVFNIKQSKQGQEIGLQLRHHLSELACFLKNFYVAVFPVVPLSGDHSHYVVKRHVVEPGRELHVGEFRGRVLRQFRYEPLRFVPSDSGEAVDAEVGKHVEGSDAAEVAPVFPVGSGS